MSPTPAPPSWTAYCDGSASPNPGPMGLGIVLKAPDGSRETLSQAMRTHGCNNEAELMAVTAVLHALRARGVEQCDLFCDSTVVVEQLTAAGAVPIARLAAGFEAARTLLGSFEAVRLQWIPRHRNGEADALAREALGMAPKASPDPSGTKRANRRRR